MKLFNETGVKYLVVTGGYAVMLPAIEDARKVEANPLNANFHKKEFQDLWGRINRKAAFTMHFETAELVAKAVAALDAELKVTPLLCTVQRGEQTDTASYDALKRATPSACRKQRRIT